MEIKKGRLNIIIAFIGVLGVAPSAFAQESTSYPVTFQQVSNSCSDIGLTFDKSTLAITRRGKKAEVSVPNLPKMTGKARRGGKFKVTGRGKVGIQGIIANISAAGRSNGKKLQLVLVAEYYRDGKAVCSQSWDGAGTKK